MKTITEIYEAVMIESKIPKGTKSFQAGYKAGLKARADDSRYLDQGFDYKLGYNNALKDRGMENDYDKMINEKLPDFGGAPKGVKTLKKPKVVGQVTGYSHGKKIENDVYEVVIGPPTSTKYGDHDAFYITYNNGASRTPDWDLMSILYDNDFGKAIGDSLYIDMGQKWLVKGLDPILKKLRKMYDKYVD